MYHTVVSAQVNTATSTMAIPPCELNHHLPA
nr:MAG TPA: hypothetical protein [Caudoviricetes sp.]